MSLYPPPDDLLSTYPGAFREFLTRCLWAIQDERAARVTSWWRAVDHNAVVGGHPYSLHRLGLAIDLVGGDHFRLAERFRMAGLVPVIERDHLHVQAYPAGTLPQSLFRW